MFVYENDMILGNWVMCFFVKLDTFAGTIESLPKATE